MVIRKLYTPPVVTRNGAAAVVASTARTEPQPTVGFEPAVVVEPTTTTIIEPTVAFEPAATAFTPVATQEFVAAEEVTVEDDVTVTTSAGKVKGIRETLPNGSACVRFSGIPYAKAPVGELRFKPPVRLEEYGVDVLDCTKERNVCVALQYYPPESAECASEDGLFLNIVSPKLGEEQNAAGLPVMVWIHGGGFNMGNANAAVYCPKYLVQEGVVVVTCNYRMGPLGFLHFPSMGIHGNMGLKDQRMVLRWVQENIASFGGDPMNVTLFGESAGGASVHLNYISESSRKYFQRAICMSGVSYNSWVLQTDAIGKTRRLAALFGADANNDEEVYKSLMEVSSKDLFSKCQLVMTDDEKRADLFFAFTPVVETADSEEPFLQENFISLMMNPIPNIPVMYGITSSEGLLISGAIMSNIAEYKSNPTKLVPFELSLPEDRMKEVAEEIKAHFFGNEDIGPETIKSLVDIVSDNMFVMAAYVASELHARYQPNTPQYFYIDSFEGELNKYASLFQVPDNLRGVCHADELLYLFGSTMMGSDVEPGSRADKFRTTMCRLWTNFAKYGNPTPPNGGIDFEWKPVSPAGDGAFTLQAADLNEELKMVENPFLDRIQFWREIYGRHFGCYLKREG